MKWDYGIVSFIDILGFSSIVEHDARSLSPSNFERINEGLEDVRRGAKESNIEVVLFSDSIILSSELDNQSFVSILTKSIEIQQRLLGKYIPTRGGIAFGKHYQDTKSLYSEALIKAYNLETSIAKFPRVVIDKNLINWFLYDQDTTQEQKQLLSQITCIDRDSETFLDYITEESLEDSLGLLNKANTKKISTGILEKYQWLSSYHNHKCPPARQELRCNLFSQDFERINY